MNDQIRERLAATGQQIQQAFEQMSAAAAELSEDFSEIVSAMESMNVERNYHSQDSPNG